jgi:hypothetical protein
MGVAFLILGFACLAAGAVLLMPYSYAWMERLGWARRWVFGIGLLGVGVGLLAVRGEIN